MKIDLTPLRNMNILKESKYNYNNKPIPRTTEILSSMLNEEYLIKWANNIGLYQRKKYDQVRDHASYLGNQAHGTIEHFLLLNKDKINNNQNNFITPYIIDHNNSIYSNNQKISIIKYIK